ncbi:MAG: hypothetical protein CM1200mP9_02070 [Gammaproteobacteria bacterium]|nr:MAG: hypothetical protein CM1200mP9_02070 [Gammaproteobacteria bacterium]
MSDEVSEELTSVMRPAFQEREVKIWEPSRYSI